MATSNRANIINDVYRILKKHYEPVTISPRSLIENLLYACCLEDAPYAVADECFGRLQESYFDWNEVRVTSIRELSEVMKPLNDPEPSATRLKRVLQSLFASDARLVLA